MTMKHLKRIFTGTLPLFLLLWAGMMGILWGLTQEKLLNDIQSSMESTRQMAKRYYEKVWTEEIPEAERPAILANLWDSRIWHSDRFGLYDGVVRFSFYSADGQELVQTQMAAGTGTLSAPSDDRRTWYLWLDPVLTQEEQLSFALLLLKNPQFSSLDSFLSAQTQTSVEAFCQITGVAEEAQGILYPKTITYLVPDGETCILDSNSNFFDGKELTTMKFSSVRLSSALAQSGSSPERALRYWEQAGDRVESFSQPGMSSPGATTVLSDGSARTTLDDGTYIACGCSYDLTALVIQELKSTALLTLAAAIAMALFTDWRQRLAIQRERNFARAAAHELKTPLAVLRAHAEALREDIAPEKREQYLDVVLSESDRMAALVGHLLELSRLESGTAPKREPVALAPLVRELLSPLALPMEQKNLRLQLELEEVSLTGDRARLGEAVENLLSNALRHAVPGRVIQVKLERLDRRARLTVYNDGPNIPPEELPRLWEPFYRADPSRSRDSGGTGLGLAIVRKAVEAHSGQCRAENRPGGVAFIMEFPIS